MIALKKTAEQFHKHVIPSLDVLAHQRLFNPEYVKEQLEAGTFDHIIWPDKLRKTYTPIRAAQSLVLAQEWVQYQSMARALRQLPAAHPGAGGGHGTSIGLWWKQSAQQKVPTLFKVAQYVLSISVSAANVERAHKNIGRALPSGGERALLSDDNLKYSVFFAANRDLVDVFGVHSLVKSVPKHAPEPKNLAASAAAAAAGGGGAAAL
jgi:hypothetical protein